MYFYVAAVFGKDDPMAASSQKKNTSSARKSERTSSSRSGGSRTIASRSKTPEAKPYRRELGGGICLILGLFACLGYFNVEAIFIDFLCGTVKGLIGYGFWLLPPCLLAAAFFLVFHHGRPVRLRVTCTLTFPVIVGCVLHLFLCKGNYLWDNTLLKTLWGDGKLLKSGGVVSGLLTQGLILLFSKIGAGIVLFLGVAAMLLVIFRLTPTDVIVWIKERPHPKYELEPEEERPAAKPEPRRSEPEKVPAATPGRRSSIDIPVDDGPLTELLEEPAPKEEKRGFFNRKPKTPSPDQILTGELDREEDRPEPTPFAPAAAVPTSAPAPIQEPLEAKHETTPPPPLEITREPAVPKVTRGETAEAAAQVSQEIEAAMEKAAPAYHYPPITLLKEGKASDVTGVQNELRVNQNRLTETIHSFGIDANIVNVTRGPSVTRYELELDQGVRLNKLTNLADDIALALGASGVRIAPIPDKISMVGIEVPNKLVAPVQIREVISSPQFRDHPSKVAFAVGKDIGGNCIVGNISKLPHMLIAGTTGSGKSVCTNSLIISLLYKATPEEVRLIMVDPKMVELGIYNGIPHLLIPVVTDPKKAAGALQWAVVEMMKRYQSFSEMGVRDLASYNAHIESSGEGEKMPQIVVVIDELADLMLVAAKEVEESICRVAQMGRAAGMHLIVATQRPSADVITGLMKANIPSRIAFAVASSLESRIILDNTGAEKLVGRGDMLYLPLGAGKPTRVQGCLITDEEVASVVSFIKESGSAHYDESVLHEIEKNVAEKEKGSKGVGGSTPEGVDDAYDEYLPAAIEVAVEAGTISVSMLQRRLKLGYSRAARLVDQMEEKGVVGPFEGSKPRQVLITKEQWQEMQYRRDMAPSAPEPVPEELDYEGDAIPQPRDLPPFDTGEEDF